MHNGYEYTIVGQCPNTGKPYLSPIAWVGLSRGPGGKSWEEKDAPQYSTCQCCPEKITGDFLSKKADRKLKERNNRLNNTADKIDARYQKWMPQE
jgi:hypothetical protein